MRIAAVLAFWVAIGAFPSSAGSQDASPLSVVAWLAGCWAADGGEPGTVEHWLPPAGGLMVGVSRTVRSGRAAAFEFMQLRFDDRGRVVFVALPSGQHEATFVMTGNEGGAATFENPNHDFPQRVIYRRLSNEKLAARIEGMRDGTVRGVDFPMSRVSCDSVMLEGQR